MFHVKHFYINLLFQTILDLSVQEYKEYIYIGRGYSRNP